MALVLLPSWAVVALVISVLVYHRFILHRSNSTHRNLPLPPGPRPLPLVGNIRDFPPAGVPEFRHWLKHKDLYGPVSSVTVMGMTLVLIHDRGAVQEILEKSSAKTSGRPTMVFANKLCGYESIVLCQDYNSKFRHCRKLLHRELGTRASAAQFTDAQEVEVNRQLERALDEPDRWLDHIKTTSAATVLKMAYGYAIDTSKPDPIVQLIEKMMTEFSLAAVPMAWAVDMLPVLQPLPDKFPGAGFKETARRWRRSIQASGLIPYRFVRRQMAEGVFRPSYVSRLAQQCEQDDGKLDPTDEEAIVWTAASLYGAAADTTVLTLTAFTAAMVMFPDVQRRAQEELDRVIGADRLPTVGDRAQLPYTDAVVKEALRWWPMAPNGFPHKATEDVEYRGLLIPKGAYLLPGTWWFLHDPSVYGEPDMFDPARFLSPRSEPDPRSDVFGYGRRVCPGRYFADTTVFLHIAKSLATFDLEKAVDEHGLEMQAGVSPKPGVLSYPTEFPFRAVPRSDEHVMLIRRAATAGASEDSDASLMESVDGFDEAEMVGVA